MCTNRPHKVVDVDTKDATVVVVDSDGNQRKASLVIIGKVVVPGNFVYLRGDYVTHVLTGEDIAAIRQVYLGSDAFFPPTAVVGRVTSHGADTRSAHIL